MAKVDIESVESQMASAGVGHKEREDVIAKLTHELDMIKAAKQNQPRVEKYKYIVANTNIPDGTPLSETPLLVIEAEDEVKPTEIINEIKNSAHHANNDVKSLRKTL